MKPSETQHQSVISHWSLVIGHWSLVISHWKTKNKGVPEPVEGQRTKDENVGWVKPSETQQSSFTSNQSIDQAQIRKANLNSYI